ncbi:MAG: hypothetical protein JNL61_14935 [Rhizobiaceae bacterium]|nr:hypothetical protein [Rhizobiaceae bacterium]
MLNVMHDCEKRRLTDRDDILTAVSILKSQGCKTEDLIVEMTKVFYVDLDEFNSLLRRRP